MGLLWAGEYEIMNMYLDKMQRFFKSRWNNEYTFTMLFTIVFGLIVHIYKFTNYLPNHDSMYNFYSDQNVLASGRWLLSFACGFSSYYDLPWINGLFSIFFIAATMVIVVALFNINNKIVIALISGLMLVCPSTVEIICFEFTADGYFMSMLFASLAALFIIKFRSNLFSVLLRSFFVCFSCGIYQAYVSFTAVLVIGFMIYILFDRVVSMKFIVALLVRLIVSLIIGLLFYYLIWKLCMFFQSVVPTDYQGINSIGFLCINGFVSSLKKIVSYFIMVIFEKNILKHGISIYAILNILFIFLSLIGYIIAIIKTKLYKQKSKIAVFILCFLSLPIAICMWSFVSTEVDYSYRMLHSIIVIVFLNIFICQKFFNSFFSLIMPALNMIMVINLMVSANIAYYYLNFEYENTYSEAIKLEYALNKAIDKYGKDHKIAIIGNREEEVALDQSTEVNCIFMYTNMIEKSLLLDSAHTKNYLKNVLYFDAGYSDFETIEKIKKTEDYKKLTPFFNQENIELIENVITVKLG